MPKHKPPEHTCWNCHDELLEACKRSQAILESLYEDLRRIAGGVVTTSIKKHLAVLTEVIARAERSDDAAPVQ
jgi:hypothetical protein